MAKKGWSKLPSGFIGQVEEDLGDRARALALQALTGIVERSPVGNPDLWEGPAPAGYVGGTFRGNNFVTVGRTTSEFDDQAHTKSAAEVLADGVSAIRAARVPYTIFYIQNNSPYGESLENGSSTQAPSGIYALTMDGLRP